MVKKRFLISNFKFLFFLSFYLFLSKPAQAAHFYLEPQSGEYNKDEEFEVQIKLDTANEETSGVDVIFNFNKEVLEIKSVSFNSLYSLNDAQIDNNNGYLKIYSTMNGPASSYKGTDRLATIKIKGLSQEEGKLSFVCQSGETGNDTNIWKKGGGDIIDCGALKEGNYKIKAGCQVPKVPENVKAVSGPGPGQVILSWDKVSGAKYYSLNYGPSSLNYLWGANNVGDVDSYVVSGLEPGKPYYFIVMANNDCGSSGALQEVAAYAGKAEKKKYWQEPEVVYLPEEILPSREASPSVEASSLAELTPLASPSLKPAGKKLTEKKAFPCWLKWVGLSGAVLVILAFIGKKLVEKEME